MIYKTKILKKSPSQFFSPKYYIVKHNVSNIFSPGVIIVPGAAGAIFVGGLITKCLKLKIRGMLWICIGCGLLSVVAVLIMMMRCEQAQIAGITAPYNNQR